MALEEVEQGAGCVRRKLELRGKWGAGGAARGRERAARRKDELRVEEPSGGWRVRGRREWTHWGSPLHLAP